MTQWIKEAIWEQLKDIEFELLDISYPESRENLSHSRDVPISPERYQVRWHYSRDFLQKILPHYAFKGVDAFYDILKIYEKPFLFHYITNNFIETIKNLQLDPTTICIATPEMRGVPIAAAVAEALQVPLVIIRKPGKIPGRVIHAEYANAYAKEMIEISDSSDVKGKNVILMDDGLASGGTAVACCDLIQQLGGNVAQILAMIHHTYTEKSADLAPYSIETLFDFASEPPVVENDNMISFPIYKTRNTNAFFNPPSTQSSRQIPIAYQAQGKFNYM
ncbi:MAG: phosphoribosyltransferase family protein [Gammaproteobacteria bacterium]|nr:phosphoribosyltransferase family protein [Gammaproteobacteria bacterium]